MANEKTSAPREYLGVMVAGTFTDLERHRAALIRAIKGNGLTDVAMENDSAKPIDVIDSSLQKVRDASAYIGIIGRKYGQMPECPIRNPDELSITELEFNEALRLGRPILLFIMGEKHPLREADVELDPARRKKLEDFRERAKQMGPDSAVQRVYATFDSLEEFSYKADQAVADLSRYLDKKQRPARRKRSTMPASAHPVRSDIIPAPPAFYAEPPYTGSHSFLGRQAQLDVLNDWAVAADPHPVLLFDAIGGAGKSILTWEWITRYSTRVRGDWAGRFWYSFYERGAIMADFCRRALAYITGQPLDRFRKMKTLQLSEQLIRHLQNRPWLLVLDGLERVLVAYHRFDAAQVRDEEVNQPTDQIAQRDPCTAIRPEDDDLLRALAVSAPSKILITSRLVPRVLLNPANQPIPGVRRESLPGLRPADAEALLRSCGVTGDSQAIQAYLSSQCDCHPLVTGVLAGLINRYLADRGNFDAWVADPAGGGQLNLASLDLIQKRNHILRFALEALPKKSRQLLSTVALLSQAVDYPVLRAFNPHLPAMPEEVEIPEKPEDKYYWAVIPDGIKSKLQEEYQSDLLRRKEYEQALLAWQQSPETHAADRELPRMVRDLEDRGLLQYDSRTRRYDLHPVVRGVAAGGMRPDETDRYGQQVVDYFSRQTHDPYQQAETLEDLRDGLQIVRTLLRMGRYQSAFLVYNGELSSALLFNLEACAEILSLLQPFFPQGWASRLVDVDQYSKEVLLVDSANALSIIGEFDEALAGYYAALFLSLKRRNWPNIRSTLHNITTVFDQKNNLANWEYCVLLSLDIADLIQNTEALFKARLDRFEILTVIGKWAEAGVIWQMLDPMGRDWFRGHYLPGDAEYYFALSRFYQGDLTVEDLAHAEKLAREGMNRMIIRSIHSLRGEWQLENGLFQLAVESLHEAVRMARAVGIPDEKTETLLALSMLQLGQLANPCVEASRLSQLKQPANRALADLWLTIGDREQACRHALAAYKWAWADGEPYVHRYELDKVRTLLNKLGVEIPLLPPYDPAQDKKLPWENEMIAAIEELRTEKKSKSTTEPEA